MRLFVLAAGKGTRLWPLTKTTPKILLDTGKGLTLLDKQIQNAIESKNIDEVVLITGYLTDQIEQHMEKNYTGKINYKIVYNPFYDVSNNLLSLWVAHHLMEEKDFAITNGDNLYRPGTYDDVIGQVNNREGIFLTIDFKEEFDDDDMKVSFGKNDKITRVHKDIPLSKTSAESVGLSIVSGAVARKNFVEKLIELAKNMEYRNKFWLEIYNSFIDENGLEIQKLEIPHTSWQEMDFHPDIELIRKYLTTRDFD
jgi:choline kinase